MFRSHGSGQVMERSHSQPHVITTEFSRRVDYLQDPNDNIPAVSYASVFSHEYELELSTKQIFSTV